MGWVNFNFKADASKNYIYSDVGHELDANKYTFVAEVYPEIGMSLEGIKFEGEESVPVSDPKLDTPIRKLFWLWRKKEEVN